MEFVDSRAIKKSRKEHICDYCNGTIEKGASYIDDILKEDGELYHWKMHPECEEVSKKLWDFINPYEGMGQDDFHYGLIDFWKHFICYNNCPYIKDCEDSSFDDCHCGFMDKEPQTQARWIYKLLRNRHIAPDESYKWHIIEDIDDNVKFNIKIEVS